MAIKVGTDEKKKVIAVVVLMAVVIGVAIYEFAGGPSTPAPVAKPAQAVTLRQGPPAVRPAGAAAVAGGASGLDARLVTNAGLDPALHLEKLALSESIDYAGNGRNIFSLDSAPMRIEEAAAPARPTGPVQPAAYVPPPVPQPPSIDLKYFGYSSGRSGAKEAFLVHGDDIFQAAAGEIVNHRYKVVAVDAHSVQITDLSYNNTQTLPLVN